MTTTGILGKTIKISKIKLFEEYGFYPKVNDKHLDVPKLWQDDSLQK
jgi:hypothetical protein